MKTSDSKYAACLYFTSNALARKIEKLAAESWKKVGLSPGHAYLLMAVLDEPGMQPGAIAAEMQLTPSTITRFIEKLEEKKLVVRTTEGKITNVYPTPKAKELQLELKNCVKEFYEKCISILGKEESTRFIKNLSKVADKIDT
ncbi:MAG: winged helix-turn-helix transcriptional regulator [Sediminibacterium sp.]